MAIDWISKIKRFEEDEERKKKEQQEKQVANTLKIAQPRTVTLPVASENKSVMKLGAERKKMQQDIETRKAKAEAQKRERAQKEQEAYNNVKKLESEYNTSYKWLLQSKDKTSEEYKSKVKEMTQKSDAYKEALEKYNKEFEKEAKERLRKSNKESIERLVATPADVAVNVTQGFLNIPEGIADAVTHMIAQSYENKGNKAEADRLRRNAMVNQTQDIWLGKAHEYLDEKSYMPEIGDEISQGVGYSATLGGLNMIPGAGKIISDATLMTSAMGSGLNEAFSVPEVSSGKAWTKAVTSAGIEVAVEKLFGILGYGGSSIDDMLQSTTKNIKNGLVKAIADTGLSATGEAIEELLSYAGDFLLSHGLDLVDTSSKMGYEWNSEEVFRNMFVGFMSAGVSQGPVNVMRGVNSNTNQDTLPTATAQQIAQGMTEGAVQGGIAQVPAVDNTQATEEPAVLPRANEKVTGPVQVTEQVRGQEVASYVNENNLAQSVKEKMQGIVERTNKISSRDVELRFEALEGNRKAQTDGNTITIDISKASLGDLIHEITHNTESGDGYTAMSDYILTELDKRGELQTIKDDIRSLYQPVYESEGRTFTDADLDSEIVARYTERFAGDANFVNKITQADRNFAQKICDWIREKVNYYRTVKNLTAEQRAEYDELRRAEKLWLNALKSSDNSNTLATAKYNNGQNYSIDKPNFLQKNSRSGNIAMEGEVNNGKEWKQNNILPVSRRGHSGNGGKQALEKKTTNKNYTQNISQKEIKEYNIKASQKVKDVIREYSKEAKTNAELVPITKKAGVIYKYKERLKDIYNIELIGYKCNGGMPAFIHSDIPNKVFVRMNSTELETLRAVLAHEVGHLFEVNNPQLAKEVKEIIRNELYNYDGKLNERGLAETAVYSSGVTKVYRSDSDLYLRERFADQFSFYEDILDVNVLEIVKQKNVPAYKKIIQIVEKVFNDVKDFFSKEMRLSKREPLYTSVIRESTQNRINRKIAPYVNASKTSGKIVNTVNKQSSSNTDIRYSLSDTQGRTLTKEQQDFFKDSQAKDENGNLMVLYHGTPNGGFTKFDYRKRGSATDVHGVGDYGKGFYFTPVKEGAESYTSSDNVASKNPQVYEVYLNMEKPLRLDILAKIQKDVSALGKKYGQLNIPDAEIDKVYEKYNITEDQYYEMSDLYANLEDNWQDIDLSEYGYDGVINERRTEFVVFNSNQIKNIDNTNPTSNDDIRYSLGDDAELSVEAKKLARQYANMSEEQLNKEFSEASTNMHNMQDVLDSLSKEYKEFQKSDEFISEVKSNKYDGTAMQKAKDYIRRLEYYELVYKKYKTQRDAINSVIIGLEKDTRSPQQIVKDAEKHFGVTNDFNETGYIDLNGNQIDFSGKNAGGPAGRRTLDHREIGQINVEKNAFIKMGNIRILPEGHGVNLAIEPNKKQYDKLREYIDSVNGEVHIDIAVNGDYIEYSRGTSSSKIINDIKTYFETGNFPKQSGIAQFRYSLSDSKDNQGRQLTKEQEDFFKDSKARDENGELKVLYHGSNNEFTIFDLQKTGKSNENAKIGFWFTETEVGARNFADRMRHLGDKPTTYKVYLNLKNPKIYEPQDSSKIKQSLEKKADRIESQMSELKKKHEKSYTTLQDVIMLSNYAKYSKLSFEDFLESRDVKKNEIPELIDSLNKYKKLETELRTVENELKNTGFDDAYEQFSTDVYAMAGQGAYEANFMQTGMQLKDVNAVAKLRQHLINQGYDGIIIKNTDYDFGDFGGTNNQYVAFYSNQIKNVENVNPTLNNDIRYSLSDNKGRELSKEQQEYFKDSKVRDENGNLVTVYHGTGSAGFTEFNRNVNFFTDNKEVAETYTWNNGIYEGYINITNPVIIDANSEIWSKIAIDNITIDGINDIKEFLSNYGASIWKEAGKLRTSTADLVSAIEEAIDEGSIEADGVIIKNIYDEGAGGDGTVGKKLGTDYITFAKNQFKNVDNKKPTSNPDIRYSVQRFTPATELDTTQTYAEGRKKAYNHYKYGGDKGYDNKIVEQAKDLIKANHQGRRTKDQWLKIADTIGANTKGMEVAQIEQLAYKSWFENKPNDKENLNRQGQKYVKFTIDEWINRIYESAKKATQKTITADGKTITFDDYYKENMEMFNSKEDAKRIFDAYYENQQRRKAQQEASKPEAPKASNDLEEFAEKPEGKERKHYKSIATSEMVGEHGRNIARNLLEKDRYIPASNAKQLEQAESILKNAGVDASLESFRNKIKTSNRLTPEDLALGETLIQIYSRNGDTETLNNLIQDVAIIGTELGQTVQALSLIRKMTPEGQLMTLQKAINRLNMSEKTNIQLTTEQTKKIVEAKTDVELQEALSEVTEEIAQQLPLKMTDKLRSWRYLSMLGNPRTHIRNILSNTAMKGTKKIKDTIAGGLEDIVNPAERTRTLKKASKETKEFAKADASERIEIIANGGKYDISTAIKQSKKQFDNKVINALAEFNSNALEAEDKIFLKSAYSEALAKYMTANNLTASYLQSGTKEANIALTKARDFATLEAQVATFRQFSWLASKISQIENKNNFTKVVVGGLLPFKKTPINIAKAGIEYSPVGLMKNLSYDAYQLKKGNITANEFIDNISKGLTGTSLSLIGYFLAQVGLLKASGDDDDRAEDYAQSIGEQQYAIQIGNKSITIDWLSPSAMPLFVGAEFYNALQGKSEISLNALATATTRTLNPLTEMSMLQSFASTLSSFNTDGSAGKLGDMGANMIESYLGQYFPTIVGQLARIVDDTERDTYYTDKKGAEARVQRFINKQVAKTPFLSKTLEPRVDVWGEEVKRDDNIALRAFNQLLNPAYVKTVKSSTADKEVQRLYKASEDSGVLPKAPGSTFSIEATEYKLTPEEYTTFKKSVGKYNKNVLNNIATKKEYTSLSDAEKIKTIDALYDDSREKAKQSYADKNNIDFDSTDDIDTLISKKNLSLANAYIYRGNSSSIKSDKDSNGETIDGSLAGNKAKYIMGINTTDEQKDLLLSLTTSSKIKPTVDDMEILGEKNYSTYYSISNAESREKYVDLVSTGMNTSALNKYINNIGSVEGKKNSQGKTISGTLKTAKANYINSLSLNKNEKLILFGKNYELSSSEKRQVMNYINGLNISKQQKLDIYDQLKGVTIKNGKVYW